MSLCVSLPFVSNLVPGCRVEKETVYFFILCAHIQYIHIYIYIYLYHNLQNQKVEFPMQSLFFSNQLF